MEKCREYRQYNTVNTIELLVNFQFLLNNNEKINKVVTREQKDSTGPSTSLRTRLKEISYESCNKDVLFDRIERKYLFHYSNLFVTGFSINNSRKYHIRLKENCGV